MVKKVKQAKLSILKMEQAFKKLPAQIVAQTRIELSLLKKQEVELKKEFKKLTSEQKAVEKNLSNQSQIKLTAAGKKKIIKMKKALTEYNKAMALLDSTLIKIQKIRGSLQCTQEKFLTIKTELNKLKTVTIATATKPQKKTNKKSIKLTDVVVSSAVAQDVSVLDSPVPENVDAN